MARRIKYTKEILNSIKKGRDDHGTDHHNWVFRFLKRNQHFFNTLYLFFSIICNFINQFKTKKINKSFI